MLFKLLSLGSNVGIRSPKDEKYLINKYQDYIDSIFISPPEEAAGTIFSTSRDYCVGNTKDTEEVLDYAKSLGIKIDFPINGMHHNDKFRYYLDDGVLDKCLAYINKWQPEEITTVDTYIDYFKENYPNCFYVRSFNCGFYNDKILAENKYDSYIPRHYQLWDVNQRPKNKESRILINHGCPICVGCFGQHVKNDCRRLVYKEIEAKTWEGFLAYHTWWGQDINHYTDCFGTDLVKFKVGTRGYQNVETVDKYLDVLTNAKDISNFLYTPADLHCCAENEILLELCEEEPAILNNFNYQKFNQEKLKLWQKVNPNITQY